MTIVIISSESAITITLSPHHRIQRGSPNLALNIGCRSTVYFFRLHQDYTKVNTQK